MFSRLTRIVPTMLLLGLGAASFTHAQQATPPATADVFPNGDMSRGAAVPEGWAVGWTGSGKLEARSDTQTYKSAPASLDVRSVGGAAQGGAAHALAVLSSPFTLGGTVKSAGSLKSATVAVQSFDGAWKQIGWTQLAQVKGTTDWQAFSQRVELPKDAAHVQMVLLIDGDGQAWLDDVRLVPDKPAPAPPAFAEAVPLPVAVAPSDPHLHYEGRFDTSDANGPRCAWPASAVSLRFSGSALNVTLKDQDSDRYQIVVDGKPTGVLTAHGGTHTYRVFEAPKPGPHTVTLVKNTEAFFGTTQFQGFQISQSGKMLPLPAKPAHRIEIVGDSISCGYGNLAKDQHEKFSPDTESAYFSYGEVAARALNAGYVCVAWSGRKMWPNNTMGEIYDKTLPLDPGSHWDFAQWTPDVVLINLSTNDWSGGAPDRKGWTAGYEAFLTRLRTHYPQAAIYCATSPMMGGKQGDEAKSYLTQIVSDESAGGDKNVRLLVFDVQDGKNGFGADWHPSVKTDQIMADKMAGTLASDLGWTVKP